MYVYIIKSYNMRVFCMLLSSSFPSSSRLGLPHLIFNYRVFFFFLILMYTNVVYCNNIVELNSIISLKALIDKKYVRMLRNNRRAALQQYILICRKLK